MTHNPFLISADELAGWLGRPGLAVVDGSWYLPAQKRFARTEYEAAHIPGAAFFDQDAVVDPASSLPHALPPEAVFSKAAGRMGISDTDTIVVYDGMGLFSAPRVWWLFRVFGAKDVRILDGGFPAWQRARLPVEAETPSPAPANFTARLDRDAVASLEDVKAWVKTGGRRIADARPADRFAGEAPEPREGVRAGHMPGAASVPISLVTVDGHLKPPAALRDAFAAAGVDPDGPVVTSCGSGVTAAVLNLALASLGNHDVKLYDGSWTEWGAAADTPVETGR